VKVCLLGGSGFIGTHLARALLAQQHEVSVFDLEPSVEYPHCVSLGDVRDAQAVQHAVTGSDCVIQLAAAHRDDVEPISLYREVNVGGAISIVAAMKAANICRAIFVSTAAVYGSRYEEPDEGDLPQPDTPYGESKLEAEIIFRSWQAESPSERSLLILRPTVVFGEGNRGNVHSLIEQIRHRRFAMVGDGANRKSLAYIGNLIEFTMSQLDAPNGVRTVNFVDKPDLSMREFTRSIYRAFGRDPDSMVTIPFGLALGIGYVVDVGATLLRRRFPISAARVRKFCRETRISNKALTELGFSSRVDLETGLRYTIAAIENASGTTSTARVE
jgi:GlcNAc-P-P-Und epimerase